jgi:hypothetical protein
MNQILILQIIGLILFIILGTILFIRIAIKSQNRINVCPKCGSTDLEGLSPAIYPNGSYFFGSFIRPIKYKCKCGYEGLCPTINKDKVDSFRKKLKKS